VGAQPNLSLLQISNFNVATPQQSEQTQIGNYFKELDGLILLQEQKLEKVKILKKAMLEKMFPNAGADVPEIRFEGFDGKWEKEALGEIATNKSGKYNPKNQVSFVKCVELEYIQSETGRILGFVNGSQLGSIKNVFRENDVLFGKLRPYLKKYCYPDFAGVCSSEIWVLNGKKIINIFLYYLIQTNLFIALANQSSGSKMPRADWNVLQNGLFFYPFSKKEQKKIGVYFQNLDKLISQSQQKIEQLKHLKQALLQKMFI
ncbi:MAG TPA: restriction endonuclease subunit S, partial [Candidatus Babeliaceae bacterium]|nr:restriction endonuclease subunit S [Candidatus Babeliaceae bacterium]